MEIKKQSVAFNILNNIKNGDRLTVGDVVDTINNNFNKGLIDELTAERAMEQFDNILEKAMSHKYFRREGGPGHYRYYYTEAEYKQAKGQKEEEPKKAGNKEKEKYTIPAYAQDARDKVMDLLQEWDSDYTNPNKVSAKRTSEGNWRLYYDDEDTGLTIGGHVISTDAIRELEWEYYGEADDEREREEINEGNKKFEYNGVTIYTRRDTSGGQNNINYRAPDVSDKWWWNLDKLKQEINKKRAAKSEHDNDQKKQIQEKIDSLEKEREQLKKKYKEGDGVQALSRIEGIGYTISRLRERLD